MGMHTKHVPLDQAVHSLEMLTMAGATVATAAEALLPRSFPLAAARAMLQVAVGAWFVQIGRIMFLGSVAWEPTSHAAGHMVPAVFVGTLVVIAAAFVGAYLALRRAQATGLLGRHAWLRPQCGSGGGGASSSAEYNAVATMDDDCRHRRRSSSSDGLIGAGAAAAGPFEMELGVVRAADHSRCLDASGGWRHSAKRGAAASIGKARFSVGSLDS
jgi:hypothetical protein